MRRRTVLAATAGLAVPGLAGCLDSFGTDPTPSPGRQAVTTCTDPPWNDAVAVEGTPNTSKEGNMTGYTYALEVEHADDDEGEVRVAIRLAERTDRECAPVAFQRVFALDPGERAIVRDPLAGGPGGEYTLIADLQNGGRATADVRAFDDGIPNSTAYFVEVSGDVVGIRDGGEA